MMRELQHKNKRYAHAKLLAIIFFFKKKNYSWMAIEKNRQFFGAVNKQFNYNKNYSSIRTCVTLMGSKPRAIEGDFGLKCDQSFISGLVNKGSAITEWTSLPSSLLKHLYIKRIVTISWRRTLYSLSLHTHTHTRSLSNSFWTAKLKILHIKEIVDNLGSSLLPLVKRLSFRKHNLTMV